jgi:NAD(P)-dependent dehydrogenase (short-subunit alcohol dehydrogenase family)
MVNTTMAESQLQQEFFERDRSTTPQHQDRQPGLRGSMQPKPDCGEAKYIGSGKLTDQVAIITGGDSGIGRAAAIAFAREGADVAIAYLDEHEDAKETAAWVEKAGQRCKLYSGDIGDDGFCRQIVDDVASSFGRLDIVVNNAAEQHRVETPEELTREQVEIAPAFVYLASTDSTFMTGQVLHLNGGVIIGG